MSSRELIDSVIDDDDEFWYACVGYSGAVVVASSADFFLFFFFLAPFALKSSICQTKTSNPVPVGIRYVYALVLLREGDRLCPV